MEYCAYVAGVKDYSQSTVKKGLIGMLDGLGGISHFAHKGQKVLIKPNLIARRFESQTHPVVVVELAKLFREAECDVSIGDSTAWNSVMKNAHSSGLLQLTQENAIPLFELKNPVRVRVGNRTVTVSRRALEADVIINVPKLKTHQQLKLSAGIKNMFGCVPGKRKALWHFRAGGDEDHFGRMLIRTYQLCKPTLTVIDAIDAMEGRGPINGTLRRIGVLIGSADGFAAERVACELVDCDPMSLITMATAKKAGLGPEDLSQVRLLGDDLSKFKIGNFQFPKRYPIGFSLSRVLKSALKQAWLLGRERFEKK